MLRQLPNPLVGESALLHPHGAGLVNAVENEAARQILSASDALAPVPGGGRCGKFLQRTLQFLVLAYFVVAVAAHWRSTDGFGSLVHFGDNFDGRRLPELSSIQLTSYPRAGYDGQFYAQLAVRPDVTAPEVQHVLDNPRYRARRIFMPLVAHVLGGGRPWAVVQAYALLNVAAWLGLAWWLHRQTAVKGLSGTLVWASVLLSLGALESVQLALTDLPSTVLLVAAVVAFKSRRWWLAVLAFAAAGLTRETSALAAGVFAPPPGPRQEGWRARLLLGVVALLPVAGWLAFLTWRVPVGDNGVYGNFDWPGSAIARHLWLCGKMILSGEPHLRHFFAPLAILGLGYQSFFLLRRAATDETGWARMAVPFAVMFWLLGDWVWAGYWAVARACLPMSVAFFLSLPYDRRLWWRLALTSLCLPHALYRFWPEF